MDLKALVGSGSKIWMLTLPFLVVGLILNIAFPSFFVLGGPPPILRTIAIVVLAVGLIVWIWSVALILMKVPQGALITNGPYSVVRHPLYTSVALLVIPPIGALFDTWLGVAIGLVMYFASRRFSREEEVALAERFGSAWDAYRQRVRIPWL